MHRLKTFKSLIKDADSPEDFFQLRLSTNLSIISSLFFSLYPKDENELFFHQLLNRMKELKAIDLEPLQARNWHKPEQLADKQLYIDLFNKNINDNHKIDSKYGVKKVFYF